MLHTSEVQVRTLPSACPLGLLPDRAAGALESLRWPQGPKAPNSRAHYVGSPNKEA